MGEHFLPLLIPFFPPTIVRAFVSNARTLLFNIGNILVQEETFGKKF